MHLTDILASDGVLLHLKAATMDSALEQIAARAGEMKNIPAPLLYAALRERVAAGVGVGHGVAIPHARIPHLREVTGIFVRLITPIPSTEGEEPIALMFVLLAPEDALGQHLRVLASVAGVLRCPDRRKALLAAPDAEAVFSILERASVG